MADARAEELLRLQSEMEQFRAPWDSHWTEIAERILPHSANFNTKTTAGDKRTSNMYDATGALALTRFGSALESMLVPRDEKWHRLTFPGKGEVPEDYQLWFDAATDALFEHRGAPLSNFNSQIHEHFISLGAFGTGCFLIEEMPGYGPRYRTIFLGEIYCAEDQYGSIDTVHRKFELTARQAFQKFGEKLPDKIKTAGEREPLKKFEFLHCVGPNREYKRGRKDKRGMAFASYYVACDGATIVADGGYRSMPYLVSRYMTVAGEIYGRSPAMLVLPDIKMVNEMSRTSIRAAHLEAEPPMLAHDDGVMTRLQLKPNAVNWGGVDENGRAKVIPLQSGRNVSLTLEMMDQRRKVINDAFLLTLFQILVEQGSREMTAKEVTERQREKAALLAPAMGRQQSELLGPVIARELEIMLRNDMIDPPPRGLSGYDVRYQSPLSKVLKSEEATGIYRWLEGISGMAQFAPEIVDIPDYEAISRDLAKANGISQRLINSPEKIAEKTKQKQQAAMMQQAIDAAPALAGAAKNITQAQETSAGINASPA